MIPANKTTATGSIRSALIIFLLLASGSVHSQATQQQTTPPQGARLTSTGGFDYDNKTGVVIFKDDVVFEQDTMKITADKATVKRNDKNEIEKIIAQGSPATFQLEPGENQPLIVGTGDTIEYKITDGVEIVLIIGHANFEQGGSVSKCDQYEINITAQTSSGSNNCEAVWVSVDTANTGVTPTASPTSSNQPSTFTTTDEPQPDSANSQ